MATFTEQLMQAKRQARLQGRPISQQEAAGISQGVAQTAAERTLAAEKLGLEKTSQETQAKQFAEQLATQKQQYESTLANQRYQFGEQMGLETEKLKEQITSSERMYNQAVATLAEQIRQYNESSATQKAQFGVQMEEQIKKSEREAEQWKATYDQQKKNYEQAAQQWKMSYEQAAQQWKENYALLQSDYVSKLVAAGQPIPASMAPEGWNPNQYLKNNPDVAENAYWSVRPLEHWWMAGKGEGRSYK